MWSEFVNLTAVVMTLLELQTDPLVPIEIKKAIAQSGNIPGTGNFIFPFSVLNFPKTKRIWLYCRGSVAYFVS